MSSRGVHFALSSEDRLRLLAAKRNAKRLEIIEEDFEERDDEWSCETDKAWNAIHRCLTDGRLEWSNGTYPLNQCILGGMRVYKPDDYIAVLVEATSVLDVANALTLVQKDWFRSQYFQVLPKDYGPNWGEDDFEYTWSHFEHLVPFFAKAAHGGRSVLFTAAL